MSGLNEHLMIVVIPINRDSNLSGTVMRERVR
jgi:hypothetical protein